MTETMRLEQCLEANAKLCETLRSQSIAIPEGYRGTVNPGFLPEASNETSIRIAGNSSGPFDPKSYFMHMPQERMLVILKEPYITEDSFAAGDRGGHAQAEEYLESISRDGWAGIGNSTYQNIAKIAYSVLTGQVFDCSESTKNKAARILLEQVSVINVNCFPCVCETNSTDSLISRWADRNYESISRQIELYNAKYIYCGGVGYDCFRASSSLEGLFGPYRVNVLPHPQIAEIAGCSVYGKRDFYYADKHLVINGHHPSRFRYKDLTGLMAVIRHQKTL